MPALLYNANGDIATVSSFTLSTTAGTMAAWVFFTDDTARQRVLSQFGGVDMAIMFRGDSAGDPIQAWREGATYAEVGADSANFAAYALNTWLLIIFSWDGTESRLYVGNQTLAPAEPSAYTTQTTLVTPTSGTSSLFMGNEQASSTRWVRGSIDRIAIYPTKLTQTERNQLWQGTVLSGASGFWLFGHNGTTDIPDVSGNGLTATITSLDLVTGWPRGPMLNGSRLASSHLVNSQRLVAA